MKFRSNKHMTSGSTLPQLWAVVGCVQNVAQEIKYNNSINSDRFYTQRRYRSALYCPLAEFKRYALKEIREKYGR